MIAVSEGMGDDILRSYPRVDPARVHVVYNGIDLDRWKPNDDPDLVALPRHRPRPADRVFVGRITRQKGLPYLLRAAARRSRRRCSCVLCAGAPDTQEILAEVSGLVRDLQAGARRRRLDRPDPAPATS